MYVLYRALRPPPPPTHGDSTQIISWRLSASCLFRDSRYSESRIGVIHYIYKMVLIRKFELQAALVSQKCFFLLHEPEQGQPYTLFPPEAAFLPAYLEPLSWNSGTPQETPLSHPLFILLGCWQAPSLKAITHNREREERSSQTQNHLFRMWMITIHGQVL